MSELPKKFGFKDLDTGEYLKQWNLTESQMKFMLTPKKYVLFSGGYGCGKSLVLTLKAAELAEKFPNNYILMGRKTYQELRDTLLKEFFNTIPTQYIAGFSKSEMKVTWHNGTQIIFRHLDTIAESEIRSLNLGAAFIDQAEDISKEVFVGLKGRLRRDSVGDGYRKIYMSCNPALTWLFDEFKQFPQPEYELIEASTLENRDHLPKEYVEDLLKYPESYKRQYVYGVWDATLLSDRVVFDREYQERMMADQREPIKTIEGLNIYREFIPKHRYQMGVDCAEGAENTLTDRKSDSAAICIVDLDTDEEIASWAGRVPPDVLGEKVMYFARMFQDSQTTCTIVPEMNAIGLALLNAIKKDPDIHIYAREEFDKRTGERSLKLGWRTTRQSKPLLISRFQELLRLREPHIYSSESVAQFKTFVWSDDAHKNGAGAQGGFHDDRVIATLLGFWQKGDVKPGKVGRGKQEEKKPTMLGLRNGRAVLRGILPELQVERMKSWKTL